jgi:hypothetical protein
MVIRPYYSRAFGDQFAVVSLERLDELGIQNLSQIVAHLDGLRPASVVRFDTFDEAERYLVRRLAGAEQAPRLKSEPSRPS